MKIWPLRDYFQIVVSVFLYNPHKIYLNYFQSSNDISLMIFMCLLFTLYKKPCSIFLASFNVCCHVVITSFRNLCQSLMSPYIKNDFTCIYGSHVGVCV